MKGTPHKWCDLGTLFAFLLPGNHIQRIRYFTALTQPRPSNPSVHIRQQAYLRALATIPSVSIHLGSFRQGTKTMKVVNPGAGIPPYVNVHTMEEKGSDVNLAAFLLMDCFRQDFDIAVVVSNDTDLVTPIEMVVKDMKYSVGLLNPHKAPARRLVQAATFYKPIRAGALSASQFPDRLNDAKGMFHKPAAW